MMRTSLDYPACAGGDLEAGILQQHHPGSASRLHAEKVGAGDGNRTHVSSLGRADSIFDVIQKHL